MVASRPGVGDNQFEREDVCRQGLFDVAIFGVFNDICQVGVPNLGMYFAASNSSKSRGRSEIISKSRRETGKFDITTTKNDLERG
jgi:hypothetical protein